MPNQKGKSTEVRLRRKRILDMHIQGQSERGIAEELGISKTQVHKDIRKAYEEEELGYSLRHERLMEAVIHMVEAETKKQTDLYESLGL